MEPRSRSLALVLVATPFTAPLCAEIASPTMCPAFRRLSRRRRETRISARELPGGEFSNLHTSMHPLIRRVLSLENPLTSLSDRTYPWRIIAATLGKACGGNLQKDAPLRVDDMVVTKPWRPRSVDSQFLGCWKLLVALGSFWCQLVARGSCWCQLVALGSSWCQLVALGSCWWL
ncbi:unnamed protein product [Nesidiocoris tenuis]|uniref:Uncharacterized protein n=1 Tax=Nesidiocoris tenuis TaxID=355587 RepID=A0A6H5H5M5_9HEMI|nr:unnamed protein product [Nesidiocoris tenuis]